MKEFLEKTGERRNRNFETKNSVGTVKTESHEEGK